MPSELPESPLSDETPRREPLVRRRFIALLGMAAAGAFVARYPETVRRGLEQLEALAASHLNGPEIPVTETDYAVFLRTAGLRNISVKAILAPHFNVRAAVRNSLPPTFLWNNILPTLRVADQLARELGERVRIYSAYRSKAYNAVCPGASKFSQHLQNRALDLAFSTKPAKVAALARKLRHAGLFHGGIGTYSTFVHIDTRGYNADW